MERVPAGKVEGTWGKPGGKRQVNQNEGCMGKPYGNLLLPCIPIKNVIGIVEFM